MIEFFKPAILRSVRIRTCAAAALFLACGTAFAQTAPDTAPNASASAKVSLKLLRVIIALPADVQWVSLDTGAFCALGTTTRTWTAGRAPQPLPPYADVFKTELEQAGYRVPMPGEDNLFDEEAGAADYEVAAIITDEHIKGCMDSERTAVEIGLVKGESSAKVDWQIYSPIKKEVVARFSTSASAKLDEMAYGGVIKLIIKSFAANVRELARNTDFRAAVSAKSLTDGFVLPGRQSKIGLAGSSKATKRQISDAVGSIVTLITSSASGSGVLVSNDGYMLTNAHVVGDEKQLRARWSDGIETVAQVVRVAKDRDIALVKTNPRDREPLAIKRGAVSPGQRVYAIGSPKGKEFQGTVSSGVISATRTFGGLRYIQSDVSVSPGSSGGALLDENGAVIGITVSGVENEGRAGLNLFIPIGDAMDFLNLEPQ